MCSPIGRVYQGNRAYLRQRRNPAVLTDTISAAVSICPRPIPPQAARPSACLYVITAVRRVFSAHAILCFILGTPLALQSAHATAEVAIDIKHATLEELMDIEVYSAARRLDPIQGTPSAMFVLTNEDIRRARVTSIPEALRLVPGVQVARVDANKWAVSIRGFNGRTTNKLLVLVDGRSIYDPLFAGVLWESRDVVLEDVERIEVIRGPGGTLWGANAVNGVINVITKHTRDTQNGLAALTAGTEERATGTARYGWQPGNDQYARVYVKSLERDSGFARNPDAFDKTRMDRIGFRWDLDLNARDALRMSGSWFSAIADERLNAIAVQEVDHRGGNILANWTRKLSASESFRAQLYYDYIALDNVQLGEKRDTYDFEFQHGFDLIERHQIVWGLGYRNTRDDIRNGPTIALDPLSRTDQTISSFIQDTIALVPQRWHLTLGTKFENNDYSGSDWQPNARLAWTPTEEQTWWAAISRAMRVPSRLEADLVIGGSRRGDGMIAEEIYAYEIGHRRLLQKNIWYDVAAFYNEYRNLLTVEQNFQLTNRMRAHTHGVELAVRWQAAPKWRLDAAYTYLKMELEIDESNPIRTPPATTEGSNPQHQYTLRSAIDVGRDVQFDATLRAVDDLPGLGVAEYTTLDLGFSWWARNNLELSLVGQNLLDDHHPEQPRGVNTNGTEVERGYYAKLTWKF